MISTHTLSRPYARAAFEFAKAANQTQQWSAMLELVACVLQEPKVISELGKPILTRKHKSDLLIELLAGNIDDAFSNFLHVVGENDRLALLPTIFETYQFYKLEAENCIDAEVETAFELDTQQLQNITVALSKRLKRTVNTKQKVNTALIGGISIKVGDLVIDSSVRGRLSKLAEAMNS